LCRTPNPATLIPVDGEDNLYTLTLVGVSSQAIAFSDRSERVVVQVPMQKFLKGMCFSPENPPNAALEILEADDEADEAVVELFDPVYDNNSRTLQYTVSILEGPNHSYTIFNERHDKALPKNFGPATLFIDDCPINMWSAAVKTGRTGVVALLTQDVVGIGVISTV